jgi:hypothetical protein
VREHDGVLVSEGAAMLRDHQVSFRTEESIAGVAGRLREKANIDNFNRVDIVSLVVQLCKTDIRNKGTATLKIFEGKDLETRAYVTFRPLTFNVERETWEFAMLGDPESI